MNVYVVCCNDSVEYAVIDDEKRANEKMLELKEAYFERKQWVFRDRQDYELQCLWHLHVVPGE